MGGAYLRVAFIWKLDTIKDCVIYSIIIFPIRNSRINVFEFGGFDYIRAEGAYSGAALINFFLPKQSALEGIAYLRAAFIRVDRVRHHLLLFGILFIWPAFLELLDISGSLVAVLALAVLYECLKGLHITLRSYMKWRWQDPLSNSIIYILSRWDSKIYY